MRALTIGSAMLTSACTPWVDFPDVPGPGDIDWVHVGEYAGNATLEVRAFAGPVQVGRELCNAPALMTVDVDGEFLVDGRVVCTFEEFGTVNARLVGDGVGIPFIEGELLASELTATWTGWFIDEESLYADMIGEQPYNGLELRYRGWVEAERFAPLGTGSVGP